MPTNTLCTTGGGGRQAGALERLRGLGVARPSAAETPQGAEPLDTAQGCPGCRVAVVWRLPDQISR
jgi:hypothetical protein